MKNNTKLENLITRYSDFFPPRALSQERIAEIERNLKIILPIDFKEISKVFDGYEILAGHALYSFDSSIKNYNIIDKTLYYRSCDLMLPKRYVALEETEVNFTVLETQPNENENTKVIECSIEDAYNLASEKPLIYNPTIFPSFTDFFEHLLNQEEEGRKEEREHSYTHHE